VITGHDEQGRSVVLIDGGPGNVINVEALGVMDYEIWATDAMPAPIARVPEDPSGRPFNLPPTKNGTVLRIAEFGPDPERDESDAGSAAASAFDLLDPSASKWEPGAHPGMHRTETVDYAIVLEGTINMILDVGEVVLHAGDVLVQMGTTHAWVNRSGKTTKVAFVLVDAAFEPDLAADFEAQGGH
jgi:hypothetical protein